MSEPVMEAQAGLEPAVLVLQTSAFPLGYCAPVLPRDLHRGNPAKGRFHAHSRLPYSGFAVRRRCAWQA
jgi:hypothetical protein